MKEKVLFASRCLLAFLAILGTSLEIIKYSAGMLMYYTVLSNLLVAIFSVYMLVLMVQKKNLQSPTFLRVKAMITMSIMITFVIYHLLLAPIATDFWRVENLLCHYIVPIYFFLDTLIVDRQKIYKWFDPIWWTILPVVYMVFALFNGLVLKVAIPRAKESPFPYFFLNVTKHGWPFVLKYAGIIFVAYLLAGYILYGIKSIKIGEKNQ